MVRINVLPLRPRAGRNEPPIPTQFELTRTNGEAFETEVEHVVTPPPLGAPIRSSRDDARRQIRSQLHASLAGVEKFQGLCNNRPDLNRDQLVDLAQDISFRLSISFAIATTVLPDAAGLQADHDRCLREIDEVADDLRQRRALSRAELIHALDGVVVTCIVLDEQLRDDERSSDVASH
jgi:hypothetical protein